MHNKTDQRRSKRMPVKNRRQVLPTESEGNEYQSDNRETVNSNKTIKLIQTNRWLIKMNFLRIL
jgi:hypothetical protein